jgi:nucleoside-diphosphate-sugar epimerase
VFVGNNKKENMQTILGSGGSIGIELAQMLTKYTERIRLVSRVPKKVNVNNELFPADLTNLEEVMNAVKGSTVAYLTVGLPYFANVWERDWPLVMSNVIEACKQHNCKLVFFDNIYMYDLKYLDNMDEDTPINPSSKKGKVRAKIAQMIMDEVDKGNLTALIARSADFYGPGIAKNGLIREMIFKKFATGEKANWLCSLNYKHAVTYTPDAVKATALLGNTEDAFNQVWHLPTAANPPTGRKWIEIIAREMSVKPRLQLAPKFLVRIMGLFTPLMKEMVEMLYQYDRDYIFMSKKFEDRFDFKPTSYLEGIKQIVQSDYNEKPTANKVLGSH